MAFGFADYSLIAFHFAKGGVMPAVAVPVVYAFSMLAGGAGSLLFGKMYDHIGLKVLVPVTVVGAAFAPLVFLGDYGMAVFGVLLWGLAEGVHESVMPAAVAAMIPARAARRRLRRVHHHLRRGVVSGQRAAGRVV